MTKKEMEATLTNHADWIEHLAGRMDELAAQTIKTDKRIEDLAAQVGDTSRSLKEHGEATDRRILELAEATDKRIGDLVSAIGKLIGKNAGN